MTAKIQYKLKLLQKNKEELSKISQNFGIFTLQSPVITMRKSEIHIIFTLDRSGSMGNSGGDGNTSFTHLIHTVINMMNYFTTLSNEIYITINMFDHEIVQICEQLKVTKESIKTVITNLQNLWPRGTTNIQKAVTKAEQSLMPNIQNIHIFMTDGLPTDGARKMETIAAHMPNIKNDFIGFGVNHDEKLLQGLADSGNGNYHFIETLENGGILYGTILHSIFYEFAQDIIISSKNCTFFDWKTNSWVDKLSIPSLASEQKRTFHIHVPWGITEDIVIDTSYIAKDGTVIDDVVKYGEYDANQTTNEDTRDVEVWKYLWRQKTLELMKKAKTQTFAKDILKEAVLKLGENIKIFMEKYNLNDDIMLTKLCDDLRVTLDSLSIFGGTKYINGRISSQGGETLYTPTIPKNTRQRTAPLPVGYDRFVSHNVGASQYRCANAAQTQMIRGCSGGLPVNMQGRYGAIQQSPIIPPPAGNNRRGF